MMSAMLLVPMVAWIAVQAWLVRRQTRHLKAGTAAPCAVEAAVARARLGLVSAVGDAALLAGAMSGGVMALDRMWADALPWPSALAGGALITSVLLVRMVVRLMPQAYGAFVVDGRLGLNRGTPALFLADAVKRALLLVAGTLPLAAMVTLLMESGGGLWWLWAWLVWWAAQLARTSLYPALVAPLFDRPQPLADPELKARLAALLERCGLMLADVRVVEASRRTRRANASVGGLGRCKRIVLHDTLLERLSADEVEAVLAHEAGHARCRHIPQYLAGLAAVGFAAFAALAALLPVSTHSPAATAALFVLALPGAGGLLRPLAGAMMRRWEHQADAFAARHTDPGNLVRALETLHRINATVPDADPLYTAFNSTHPMPAERLDRLKRLQAGPAAMSGYAPQPAGLRG